MVCLLALNEIRGVWVLREMAPALANEYVQAYEVWTDIFRRLLA